MAYVANIVTVAEMQFMAGENVDATGDVEANHIFLQDYAEAYLSCLLKFELTSAAFTALNATTKVLITEWAARYAGIALIQYNMLGEAGLGFSRIEAENRININIYYLEKIEKLLDKADIQNFKGV